MGVTLESPCTAFKDCRLCSSSHEKQPCCVEGLYHCMRRSRGPSGLYQGFSMGLLNSITGAGLGFATYETLCVAYRNRVGHSPSPSERGAIAGRVLAPPLLRKFRSEARLCPDTCDMDHEMECSSLHMS